MAKTRMLAGLNGLRDLAAGLSPLAAHLPKVKTGVVGAVAGMAVLAAATALFDPAKNELCHRSDRQLVASAQVMSLSSDLRQPGGVTVVPAGADKLYQDFRAIGYRLENVMAGTDAVPRVFVKTMPKDLQDLRSVDTRKQVFIKTMLPLILRVNEDLRQARARIVELGEKASEGRVLSASEHAWLDAQFARHRVSSGDIALLLRRVDVIPPSLALAQAAEESGWGTSRFAQEGRALFGQRTHAEGTGLVPVAHTGDSIIKVKSFDALLDAVRSYAFNLNTHNAYTEFRKLRAQMRDMSGDIGRLDSLRLSEMLHHYSERGPEYVDSIKTIIRVNKLRRL
ncbi:MAG: glucosaminidase domain-containing protein, partial [Alphaproteobacteria bacterium]